MRKHLNKNKLKNNCYVKEAVKTLVTQNCGRTNPKYLKKCLMYFLNYNMKKKINILFSAQWEMCKRALPLCGICPQTNKK